jgi:hypothetical protein
MSRTTSANFGSPRGPASWLVGFGSKSAEAAAMIIHLSINSSYIASTIRPTLCGNLLHVLIGRGIDLCVPQVSLDVLRRPLALRQRVAIVLRRTWKFSFGNPTGGNPLAHCASPSEMRNAHSSRPTGGFGHKTTNSK